MPAPAKSGAHLQSCHQTISHERHEDMCFHPGLNLMMNGANIQIALEAFEGGLNIRELGVSLPEHFRFLRFQAGAQKIMTIEFFRLLELLGS